jgi:hypothetical protein
LDERTIHAADDLHIVGVVSKILQFGAEPMQPDDLSSRESPAAEVGVACVLDEIGVDFFPFLPGTGCEAEAVFVQLRSASEGLQGCAQLLFEVRSGQHDGIEEAEEKGVLNEEVDFLNTMQGRINNGELLLHMGLSFFC